VTGFLFSGRIYFLLAMPSPSAKWLKRSFTMDISYRPNDYFWASRRGIQLASDIKGAVRRDAYLAALESGEDFDPIYSEPSLSEDSRRVLGRLHPSYRCKAVPLRACAYTNLHRIKAYSCNLNQRSPSSPLSRNKRSQGLSRTYSRPK
jgi:hypothetical protein